MTSKAWRRSCAVLLRQAARIPRVVCLCSEWPKSSRIGLHHRRLVDRNELGSHAVRLQAGDTVVALAGDGVRSRLVTL